VVFEGTTSQDGSDVRGEISMQFSLNERIHNQDFLMFVFTKIFRNSTNPVKAAEALWTDSVCSSMRIGRDFTDKQKLIMSPQRLIRIAKAWKKRGTILSPAQYFILENWRTSWVFDSPQRGLCEWATSPAIQLLEAHSIYPNSSDGAWSDASYDKMISRMGLSYTRRNPVVVDCQFKVTKKNGVKSQLCRITDNL